MTAPTIGLGLVRPRPRAARKSARSMWSEAVSIFYFACRDSPLSEALGAAAHLLQLVHNVDAGVQAAGRVDENRIAALRFARRDRVEDDGRWVSAFVRADHLDAGARRPDLELFDRRGPERIRRANER